MVTSDTQLTAVYTCAQSTLRVVAQQPNGTSLVGYAAQLLQVGALQMSTFHNCYTPCTFTVDNGQTYQVEVDDYGVESFSHWSDDKGYLYSWGGLYPITMPGGNGSTVVTLTAVYASTNSSSSSSTTIATSVASSVTNTSSYSSSTSGGPTTIVMPQGVGNNPGLNFSPSTVTVTAGTVITFIDQDSQSGAPHDVVWNSLPTGASPANSPQVMTYGDTFSVALTVPGTYTFDCAFHPWMHGSITVLSANTTTGTASSRSTSSTSASGSNASATVIMPQNVGVDTSLNFSPDSLAVAAGTTVTFVDQDSSAPHNVFWESVPAAASPGPANSPPLMTQGAAFSVTLTVPGTYTYKCLFHSAWMHGTIVVVPAASTSSQTSTLSTSVATSASTVSGVHTMTGSESVTTTTAAGATIDMPQGAGQGLNFSPASITIAPGSRGDVRRSGWSGTAQCGLADNTNGCRSSQLDTDNDPGSDLQRDAHNPRDVHVICEYHSVWMHGTVIVS